MSPFIRISPQHTAVRQLKRYAEEVEAAAKAPQRLFDAVRAGHLALHAAAIGALIGPSGTGAFSDKLAARHLAHDWDSDGPEPPEHTLAFDDATKALTEPGRLPWSPPLTFSAEEANALKYLNWLRELHDHPKPTSWSLARVSFRKPLKVVPELMNRIPGPHLEARGYRTALAHARGAAAAL